MASFGVTGTLLQQKEGVHGDSLTTDMTQNWPDQLLLVRHGQSEGNVARDAAYAAGAPRITLSSRDVDIPLSALGIEQARALGQHYASLSLDKRPDVLLTSPYLRAVETARIFRDSGGAEADEPVCMDERLREKEFGILDGLTTAGVKLSLPEQAEFRQILGKF